MGSAWITGATGAWGTAFTTRLLETGYDVVALGRRDAPELTSRAAELGRSWAFAPFDLDDPHAEPPAGVPDVLIHAAVSTAGDRRALVAADYLAPAALIDEAAIRMLESGRGRIGVLLPQNARLGMAGLAGLSAAQAGLWTWCESRRDELAKATGDVSLTIVIPPRTASPTQHYVSKQSGRTARLSGPDAGRPLRAILDGKRRAGRRPYLAAGAMLVR